jgi:small subunit ribosomal protein S2
MADTLLKDLLESGAHFGHQTRRWNPKMKPFIFGARGGIYIIDLIQTAKALNEAEKFVKQATSNGGKILFVSTKRQAADIIKTEAEAASMPYVSVRWLGGMLTNFRTIKLQVNRLKKIEAGIESGDYAAKYNKKEQLDFSNEAAALNRVFGGIKNLDGMPAAVFIVDVPREMIAIAEARKLGIPVIAMCDTNADPDVVDYVIPANDDAVKAVKLITGRIAAAAAEGAKAAAAKAKEVAPEADSE